MGRGRTKKGGAGAGRAAKGASNASISAALDGQTAPGAKGIVPGFDKLQGDQQSKVVNEALRRLGVSVDPELRNSIAEEIVTLATTTAAGARDNLARIVRNPELAPFAKIITQLAKAIKNA